MKGETAVAGPVLMPALEGSGGGCPTTARQSASTADPWVVRYWNDPSVTAAMQMESWRSSNERSRAGRRCEDDVIDTPARTSR